MILWILKARVFFELLELGTFECFLFDASFDFKGLVKQSLQDRAVLAVDLLLASRAVDEVESNSRRHPLFLKKILDAVEVEDMSTAYLNGRFCSKSTNEADAAIRIRVDSIKHCTFAIFALFFLFFQFFANATFL